MGKGTEEPGGAAIRIASYGPHGVHIDLGLAEHPERAPRTGAAAHALEQAFPAAEVVRGAGTIGLLFDAQPPPEYESIVRCLTGTIASVPDARNHEIPVVYDGPDLDELSGRLRLSRADLVSLHTARDFLCELVGFMPGFAYLGSNPAPLVLPRRSAPRSRVPAGSVALAGSFTGIYPLHSPGGWHWIGRSLGPSLFDPKRAVPSLFAPGDRVRFLAVDPKDAPRVGRTLDIRISLRPEPPRRGLVLLEVPPLTTLQDEGRPGALGRGIPRSGPLAPEARRNAERAVGNPRNAASLELVGGGARVRAAGRVRIALDDGWMRTLEDGESFVLPASADFARYLAIEGGFDGERALGSRAMLLGAGLGAYGGRALRAGDFLAVSNDLDGVSAASGRAERGNEVHSEEKALVWVDPGPHAEHFVDGAFERLLECEYEVSALSNRVGQRLLGPKIARISTDSLLPTAMIRGAIEVPASGEPIVLGPDHPTTGGYPVLAIVRPESFDTLGRLGPGGRFRFARR